MNPFSRSLRNGDWVVATSVIATTMSDHLTGSGIAAGTRGVVIDDGSRGWLNPTVRVRFDVGFGGMVEARAPAGSLRIDRRAGGVEQFSRRAGLVGAMRTGVALALISPLLYFVGVYLFTHRTFDGLVPALVTAAFESFDATVGYLLSNPLQAAAFLIISILLGRFAFR